eukprot:SAG31_NODE_32797_length_351_cov_1.031746_1_plen_49_part_10
MAQSGFLLLAFTISLSFLFIYRNHTNVDGLTLMAEFGQSSADDGASYPL